MNRVIVAGGRDMPDEDLVRRTLDRFRRERGPLFIIQGGAMGVDFAARRWAEDTGSPCATVPAHWARYKRMAGPYRNGWMLELDPHLVIIFPGRDGTADMLRRALSARVETWVVSHDGTIEQRSREPVFEEAMQ